MTITATHLLPVLLRFNGVDSGAWPGLHHDLKLGILAEPTRVTQKRVLLIVVDGPKGGRIRRLPSIHIILNFS